MKRKSAEEIMSATRASDIFTMDFDVIDRELEEYLARFKPEAYNTIKNFMISQKVTLLYRQAVRELNGFEEELKLIFSDPNGIVHTFECEDYSDIKLGKMYISEAHIIFVIDECNEKYYQNYIKKVTNFTKLNESVWNSIKYMLPNVTTHFKCQTGEFVIVVEKPCKMYPLKDVLHYFNDKLAPAYVASIMTRLYNFVCYLNVLGICHNGLTLDNLFFAPGKKVENGQPFTIDDMRIVGVFGGWFFSTYSDEKLSGIPREIYTLLPNQCKQSGFSDFEVDELSIKALAIKLLGDNATTSGKTPLALINWLNDSHVRKNAYEEYIEWEKVRNQTFDGHRFVHMDVSIN